jgi:uncharacterized membrane protein required for colicin V production
MTRLDWIIIAFAAFTAFRGYRRGLVRTVLSFVGLAAGAVIGARAAPHFLAHTTASHYSALIGLGAAIAGALLFRLVAVILSGTFRLGLRLAPPLRSLDSIGGLAVGAATGFALAWVVGAVAVQVPGHPKWVRYAHQSKVLHRLNQIAPPRDVLRLRASLLERLP